MGCPSRIERGNPGGGKRKRMSQKYHCNQHLKPRKTQKTRMTNLVCHATNSRSNCGMGGRASPSYVLKHKHQYKWNLLADYKYPIFCKNFSSMLIVKKGTKMEKNDIAKKKQVESIEVVSQYWFLFIRNNQQRSSGSIHFQRLVTRNIILF